MLVLRVGDIINAMIYLKTNQIQYVHVTMILKRTFRVKGDNVDIIPMGESEEAIVFNFLMMN